MHTRLKPGVNESDKKIDFLMRVPVEVLIQMERIAKRSVGLMIPTGIGCRIDMKKKLCALAAVLLIAGGLIFITISQKARNERAHLQSMQGWIKTWELPLLGADTNNTNQLPDPKAIKACTEVLIATRIPRSRSDVYLVDFKHVIDAGRRPATFYVFGIKSGFYPTYVFLVENSGSKIVAKYVSPPMG